MRIRKWGFAKRTSEILTEGQYISALLYVLAKKIFIGKAADGEVDFVAQRQGEKLYVQVTQEIRTEKNERREYACCGFSIE